MVVIGLILVAIVAAIAGGLIADRQPTPRWFNRDILPGTRTVSPAPSTFLLAASVMPILLGLMHLAQGTYARIKSRRNDSL